MTLTKHETMQARIQQRVRQFLVHSFLYYQMDESLISDQDYDQLCLRLQEDLGREDSRQVPHAELVRNALGGEASGFGIKKYPAPIISAAMHLLYQSKYHSTISFQEFLARRGYRFKTINA